MTGFVVQGQIQYIEEINYWECDVFSLKVHRKRELRQEDICSASCCTAMEEQAHWRRS